MSFGYRLQVNMHMSLLWPKLPILIILVSYAFRELWPGHFLGEERVHVVLGRVSFSLFKQWLISCLLTMAPI